LRTLHCRHPVRGAAGGSVFGSLRSAGSGTRTLLGVLIGVTFFLVQRMLDGRWCSTRALGARVVSDGVARQRRTILIARTR
jgi:hypothetical protein